MHITKYKTAVLILATVLLALSAVACDTSVKPPQATTPSQGTPPQQDSKDFIISGTTLVSYNGTDAKVLIPRGITQIGDRAFHCRKSVTAVELPDTIEHIGEQVFTKSGIKEIIIPASVRTIGEWAFQSCPELERITFSPESKMTTFGSSAFVGCESLASVTLPPSLEEIPSQAFMDCTSLETIAIPDSVHTIGTEAFRSTGLKSLTLPANIQKIESRAFYLSNALASATVSQTAPDESWKNLDDDERGMDSYVFGGCDKLQSFEVPSRCRHLKGWTFMGMNGLKTLTFHRDIRRYGEFLAPGDRDLHVIIQNEEPSAIEVMGYSFPNPKPGKLKIFVPAKSVEAYKGNAAWNPYADYIEAAQ